METQKDGNEVDAGNDFNKSDLPAIILNDEKSLTGKHMKQYLGN